MEREVGGGMRMGNTCKPMADSFQCMTKSTIIKKKKKKEEEIHVDVRQKTSKFCKANILQLKNKYCFLKERFLIRILTTIFFSLLDYL